MSLLHPLRDRKLRAFDEGLKAGLALGEFRASQRAFKFLRAQAAIHHGEPGDAIRRGAINHAADRLRDGRDPGRPPAADCMVEEVNAS